MMRRIRRRHADSDLHEEVIDLNLDAPRDLAHERRSDVAFRMDGDGRASAVRMTELLVRASLTDLDEPEPRQSGDDLLGLEGGTEGISGDSDVRRPHELRFERWLSVFEEHLDDFAQVGLQLQWRTNF